MKNPEEEGDRAMQIKKDLRRVVRRAKCEYWQEKINTASEGKDIFQMVGWSHSTGCFSSPPFVDPESGATLINSEDKRDLLIRTLLQ
jgi:hypothetical protein